MMERRDFLMATMAASAVALTGTAEAEGAMAASGGKREFYQLRKYHMQTGPQTKITDSYMEEALVPALNRLGIAPVGAFMVNFGPDTPTLYLLLPSTNVELLATVDLRLAQDAEFMKLAEPFWSAPAAAPPFLRVESSLLAAFEGWPKLTPPPGSATHAKRIFQIRMYESPTYGAHVRKVEMFHHGEFEIFQNAGFGQVFYGDTLIGSHMPNLTYMLSFPDMNAMNARWDVFRNDPAWKKLSSSPRYGYEAIVSNITNLILTPTGYSQI